MFAYNKRLFPTRSEQIKGWTWPTKNKIKVGGAHPTRLARHDIQTGGSVYKTVSPQKVSMKRYFIILFLTCLMPSAFADDLNRFVGIWAAGGAKAEGPGLFLFPNGNAYFNAMCGKAAGTWKELESQDQIEVELREESTGPYDSFTFHMDSRGWLIRKSSGSTDSNSPASVASQALQELEKTKYELPKID